MSSITNLQNMYLLIVNAGIGIANSNGYASTLASPLFNLIKGNIFVININNGIIHFIFDTKEIFIEKLSSRKKPTKMVAYYNKTITFTQDEVEKCANMNISLINDLQKNTIARRELKHLTPPNGVGDFMPGYVSTLANPLLNKVTTNIIVVGFEDGLIYDIMDSKDDFFEKYSNRKKPMKMLVYYNNITFTESELEKCWNMNLWMTNHTAKSKIANSYNETMKIVYM